MVTPHAVARAAERSAGRTVVLCRARTDTRPTGRAGVRRRFAPHQLRHAHAVEMSREGISLIVIQRQLGHADLTITSRYLRGIDNTEIIQAVHERPEPMVPRTDGSPLSADSAQQSQIVR